MSKQATTSPRISVRNYLVRCITIDTRTLAVFRIVSGALILIDLALRSQHFTRFYTEDGVVPQSIASEVLRDAFSFHMLSTSPTVMAALFVIQGLIAVQLILGYQTRIAAILSFLFVMSLNHRNTMILSHSDGLFRLLLFWAMFLPLGARWSIDALHSKEPPQERIAGIATAAILVQMVYMYSVNGYHKATSDVWRDGTATLYIFGLDHITYLLGDWMRQFPTLLRVGGYVWFLSLVASPLLLLLPGRRRWPLVVLLLGGHSMFALTVRIGSFPFVGISGVILFLQSEFWNDAQRVATRLRLAGSVEAVGRAIERSGRTVARRLPVIGPADALPPGLTATLSTFALTVAVIVVLVVPFVRFQHEQDATGFSLGALENEVLGLANAFGVRQPGWTIFAPNPRGIDRYHVFAAQTADGELLDIYNDRPFTFDRPYRQLQLQYPSYRDRFYMDHVRSPSVSGEVREVLAQYLCRQWLDERGIVIHTVEMWNVTERVTIDTIDDPAGRETERVMFYRTGCNDAEPVELELPSNPEEGDPEADPLPEPGEGT